MAHCGLRISMVPLDAKAFRYSLANVLHRYRTDPLCTIEDLEQFFDCMWMKRIWTFQDIVFSRNPVVVYGLSQITWNRLQFSTIFLASTYDKVLHYGPQIGNWLNIIRVRDSCQPNVNNMHSYGAEIRAYWLFCSYFTQTRRIIHYALEIVFSLTWLAVPMPVMIVHNTRSIEGAHRYQYLADVIMLGLTIPAWFLMVLVSGFKSPGEVILQLLRHRFAPSPTFLHHHPLSYEIPKLPENLSAIQPHLASIISVRTATDPRDMSFGLHGILKLHEQQQSLPPVDYLLSKADFYKQLSMYLLSIGKSINLLAFAAQKRCEGGPSWVPDFCQTIIPNYWEATFLGPSHDFRDVTEGSKCYQRLHHDNSTLVVKGYLWSAVTWISGDRVPYEIGLTGLPGPWFTNILPSPGDRVALISGVPFRVLVRATGRTCELLGIAFPNIPKSRSPGLRESKNPHRRRAEDRWTRNLFTGSLSSTDWYEYNARKRKEWEDAQRDSSDPSSIPEADPEVYLDDLLIC